MHNFAKMQLFCTQKYDQIADKKRLHIYKQLDNQTLMLIKYV